MKPIDGRPKKVIGLIGGSGTGKTYFAGLLQKHLNAEVIEGDHVGHQALMKPEIIQAIKARFGSQVIAEEGIVDRKALGAEVFGNPEALKDLNTIMHPKMYRMIEKAINASESDHIILDAAVMIEAGFDHLVDLMFCIVADHETRLSRLVHKRFIDQDRALKMIASGRQDYESYGDYIIDTTFGTDLIADEIERICLRIKEIDGGNK